ncbi:MULTISPECIES: hypothetical protein [unclassified Mesorhizobium]|uniref:hypothetical protein n=1 Tax=unclassified Mesorhizobium TaxID=325217 RepID=UPI00333A001C
MLTPNVDKVIVSNRTALDAKYGAKKTSAIYAALVRLNTADRGRGHATIIHIDNTAATYATHIFRRSTHGGGYRRYSGGQG